MARFVKGESGNATGKPPGVKCKKTLLLDSFAQSIVEGGMEQFQTELSKLKGKDFINAYLAVFEYVKPKLQRTELTGGEGPIVIEVKTKQ